MKKYISLLVLTLCIVFKVLSQEWAPTGAKWYYKQSLMFGNGTFSKTIESIGDTLLLGKPCKILKFTGSEFSPTSGGVKYMYEENDSVFFYQSGEFCLIYDFNAMPGDSFHLPCFDSPFLDSPYIELWVKVLNVDTVIINGVPRKRQAVNGGELGYTVWGANIQGIGNTVYMFPQGDMHYTGPIRCYEDSGGVHHFVNIPCDSSNIVSVEKLCIKNNPLRIFPNPATDYIVLENLEQDTPKSFTLNIYNVQGQALISEKVMMYQELKIDVSMLREGFYLLSLINEAEQYFSKFAVFR